jgi:hypothetical protein
MRQQGVNLSYYQREQTKSPGLIARRLRVKIEYLLTGKHHLTEFNQWPLLVINQ